jgi:hypothetical protein
MTTWPTAIIPSRLERFDSKYIARAKQSMSDAEAVALSGSDLRAHPARPQADTKANINTFLDLEFCNWNTPLTACIDLRS